MFRELLYKWRHWIEPENPREPVDVSPEALAYELDTLRTRLARVEELIR